MRIQKIKNKDMCFIYMSQNKKQQFEDKEKSWESREDRTAGGREDFQLWFRQMTTVGYWKATFQRITSVLHCILKVNDNKLI